MNKYGVPGRFRRWFTETDVKHLKTGAFRTIRITAEKEYTFHGKPDKEFLTKHFSIVSELPTSKMNFFKCIFKEFCW